MPRFRFEHSQDVDTVFSLITSPDELTRRCETLGERDVKVEVSESGSVTKTQIAREVTAKAPLIRRKLESFIADTALRSLREQHEYYARRLAESA